MKEKIKWKEEAWEKLLKQIWDKRQEDTESVEYDTDMLLPILSVYVKSGQGEVRIFNYNSNLLEPLKKRGLVKIPLTRSSWAIVKSPPILKFGEPENDGEFIQINDLTEGMLSGIKDSMELTSNPGETTLLSIANYVGIISDFYNLKERGILFTGGRQRAGISIMIGNSKFDMEKAQIEIDGGFEWSENVVIAEMKSTFSQDDFDTNQALIPFLKWKTKLKNKKVSCLVLLAQTNSKGIEYRAYDLVEDRSMSSIGMRINKNKKYIIKVN